MDLLNKQHFYINLDKRTDRKENVEKELIEFGFTKPNRISAIENEIGIIGSALSHIKCLEEAKRNNWSYVLIFEDDIYFVDKERCKNLMEKYIEYDYDVLFLGAWIFDNKYYKADDNLLKINKALTAHSYIVKSHYYDKLIENLKEGIKLKKNNPNDEQYNFDNYWSKLQCVNKWYCLKPIMCSQYNNYSDNFGSLRELDNKIKTIPLLEEDLPNVSILTPTFNRKMFLPLMISNLKNFKYPKNKLEWNILDSWGKDGKIGEKLFNDEKEINSIYQELNIKINYKFIPSQMNIGEKRNYLAKNANYEYLINMDDDDIYIDNYIYKSISRLVSMEKRLCGVLGSLLIFPQDNMDIYIFKTIKNFSLLDEASMCMTKSLWKEYNYGETSWGEGAKIGGMVNPDECVESELLDCVICNCWSGNTAEKNHFKQNKFEGKIQGEQIDIIKNIFKNYSIDIKMPKSFLVEVKEILSLANDKIKWELDDLYRVGKVINEINRNINNLE